MSFDAEGFKVLMSLLPEEETERLLAVLGKLTVAPLRGGIRRIDQLVPEVAALARSSRLLAFATPHLSGMPHLVRAIYFDKSADNNWLVVWHQDRTVAVSERFDMEGWGPWSLKAGAWHVQPPIEVLERMVTIRVHLDPAMQANGCLKIVPGSHLAGLLASDTVLERVDAAQVVYCETPRGGGVVMRPHILHASEKSYAAIPRRVLHFEYSSFQLPEGIAWAA